MNLNVLIVDDEPLGASRIQRLLQNDPDISSIEIAETAELALLMIRESVPDILFLDIEMPGMNGFELLEKLRGGKVPFVIFVTAYEEHAVQAFEVQALDYLLKPVTQQRLAGSLDRAKQIIHSNPILESMRISRMVVKDGNDLRLIHTADIDWIEADRHYVIIHIANKSFVSREPISEMAMKLDPARFARIHRSHIVNVERIAKLQPMFRGEYRVVLHNGTTLMLTRHYKKQLKKILRVEDL